MPLFLILISDEQGRVVTEESAEYSDIMSAEARAVGLATPRQRWEIVMAVPNQPSEEGPPAKKRGTRRART